jgi:adenosine kinase
MLLITGSVATDHLMTYPGKFTESLVPEQLDKLSVSFLVDDLKIRRGGVGANIAFGLGQLGIRPLLVAAAGHDFADYRSWLERNGVDCSAVHISEDSHTARFVCTTDAAMSQFASFYPGAMSEARNIELAPVIARVGVPDYVVIGANDPEAMRRHTAECRAGGYPFVADPSQQLTSADSDLVRDLIDGAAILFSNEYEFHLILTKIGWDEAEIRRRVGVVVTTFGAEGAQVSSHHGGEIRVKAVQEMTAVEPTGGGDALRAGFLAALSWGLDVQRAAEVGCVLAAYVVETVGTQEYTVTREGFIARVRREYGADAAAEVSLALG